MESGMATAKIVLDEVQRAVTAIDAKRAHEFVATIAAANEVFVTGQGRSGLVAAAFAVRLGHLGKQAHIAGAAATPPIGPGAVLVACSGSGRTRTTLLHAEEAAAAGAQVWALTQDQSSPLALAATHTLCISATPSAQPGASLFEQALFVFCDGVILELMSQLGETAETMLARHANLE
jgi:6-phospho-3-hexuloisomerase